MSARKASVERNTKETQISVSLNLDGTGEFNISSGLPFLEHMLEQVARHGLVDMDIKAEGDLEIDAHHTVEDLGITIGQAFDKALDESAAFRRFVFSNLGQRLADVISRIEQLCSPSIDRHLAGLLVKPRRIATTR